MAIMREAWSGDGVDRNVMGPPVTRTVSSTIDEPPALKHGEEIQGNRYLVAVGSRTARFRRKHHHRLLIGLLLFLIILLLSFAITMTILYVKQKRNKAIYVCNSKECIRSAANLALSMDSTADPCDDFYQFACGNWPAEHPAPESYNSYNWFNDKQVKVYKSIQMFFSQNKSFVPWAVEQASHMYKACMDIALLNKKGLQPVIEALSLLEIPKYPTILNATEKSEQNFDWLEAVINVKIYLGMDVLIGFDIFSDPKNSSLYRLVMGSPETTNPFPSLLNYKQRHNSKKTTILSKLSNQYKQLKVHTNMNINASRTIDENALETYSTYYIQVLKAMFKESGGSDETELNSDDLVKKFKIAAEEYIKIAGEVYEIMAVNLNESSIYEDDQLLADLNIPEYSVVELKNLTDQIAIFDENIWQRYLVGIFKVSNVTLDFENDKVLVFDEDLQYLMLLTKLVSVSSALTLELYIWFQVVEVMIVHTTTEMRLLHSSYTTLATGGQFEEGDISRALHCSAAVNDLMGMASTYAIADESFFKNTKPKIDKMINKLKKSLDNLVRKSTWMDMDTKISSIDKINNMKTLVGLPDWLFIEEKINKYYEGIYIKPDRHLENLINLVQVRLRKGLNRFRDIPEIIWASDPTEVNAYHTFQDNTITVPFVMLQYPFFDLGIEALEYGALGTILGHEITHGFDNIGRHFDKNGNMVQWWSNDTIEKFMSRIECFINQYSTFYITEIEKFVDGEKTVGENVADTGGVRLAFAALEKSPNSLKLPGFEHYTQEQMFFLAFGNLWCSMTSEKSLKTDSEDEHPPTKYRLRGALHNSREFANAWHCKKNSTMNPDKSKCFIF